MKMSLFTVLCGMATIIHKTCGYNVTLLESKITGGTYIEEETQFETKVISIRSTTDSKHLYTAYMLDGNILLTTANIALAVEGINAICANPFKIYHPNAREVDITVIKAIVPQTYIDKQNLYTKPVYDEFDIGIVTVDYNTSPSGYVAPAFPYTFPEPFDTNWYDEAFLYAWLNLGPNGKILNNRKRITQEIRKLRVNIYTREMCAFMIGLPPDRFPTSLLCVKSNPREGRFEQSDLGSPVATPTQILGLISHILDIDSNSVAIMVDLRNISAWIEKALGKKPEETCIPNDHADIHQLIYKPREFKKALKRLDPNKKYRYSERPSGSQSDFPEGAE